MEYLKVQKCGKVFCFYHEQLSQGPWIYKMLSVVCLCIILADYLEGQCQFHMNIYLLSAVPIKALIMAFHCFKIVPFLPSFLYCDIEQKSFL